MHHRIADYLEAGDALEDVDRNGLLLARQIDQFSKRQYPVGGHVGIVAELAVGDPEGFGTRREPDAFAENLLDASHPEDGFVVLEELDPGQLGHLATGQEEVCLAGGAHLVDRVG